MRKSLTNLFWIIRILVDTIVLKLEWLHWRKNYIREDFEARLIALGCTRVNTRNSTIFTTPNGGKIEITDNEVVINPRRWTL